MPAGARAKLSEAEEEGSGSGDHREPLIASAGGSRNRASGSVACPESTQQGTPCKAAHVRPTQRRGLMFRSGGGVAQRSSSNSAENLLTRVLHRQVVSPRPGCQVLAARQLYENIVPSHAAFQVDCPEHVLLRRFSLCGQYLIAFSRTALELVVFRHRYFTYPLSREDLLKEEDDEEEGEEQGDGDYAEDAVPSSLGSPHGGTSRGGHFLGRRATDGASGMAGPSREAGTWGREGHGRAGEHRAGSPEGGAGNRAHRNDSDERAQAQGMAGREGGRARAEHVSSADAGPRGSEAVAQAANKFESHFVQLYCAPLGRGNELLCKDFFLSTYGGSGTGNSFGIVATASPVEANPAPMPGAVPGVPAMECITFHLIRLSDGQVLDKRTFHNDFINLSHNSGAFLLDDILAILSIRFQRIHILQVSESAGRFVDANVIGQYGKEDDSLLLHSHLLEELRVRREMEVWRRRRAGGVGASDFGEEEEADVKGEESGYAALADDQEQDRTNVDLAPEVYPRADPGHEQSASLDDRPTSLDHGPQLADLLTRTHAEPPMSKGVAVDADGQVHLSVDDSRLLHGDRPLPLQLRAQDLVSAEGRHGLRLSPLEGRTPPEMQQGPAFAKAQSAVKVELDLNQDLAGAEELLPAIPLGEHRSGAGAGPECARDSLAVAGAQRGRSVAEQSTPKPGLALDLNEMPSSGASGATVRQASRSLALQGFASGAQEAASMDPLEAFVQNAVQGRSLGTDAVRLATRKGGRGALDAEIGRGQDAYKGPPHQLTGRRRRFAELQDRPVGLGLGGALAWDAANGGVGSAAPPSTPAATADAGSSQADKIEPRNVAPGSTGESDSCIGITAPAPSPIDTLAHVTGASPSARGYLATQRLGETLRLSPRPLGALAALSSAGQGFGSSGATDPHLVDATGSQAPAGALGWGDAGMTEPMLRSSNLAWNRHGWAVTNRGALPSAGAAGTPARPNVHRRGPAPSLGQPEPTSRTPGEASGAAPNAAEVHAGSSGVIPEGPQAEDAEPPAPAVYVTSDRNDPQGIWRQQLQHQQRHRPRQEGLQSVGQAASPELSSGASQSVGGAADSVSLDPRLRTVERHEAREGELQPENISRMSRGSAQATGLESRGPEAEGRQTDGVRTSGRSGPEAYQNSIIVRSAAAEGLRAASRLQQSFAGHRGVQGLFRALGRPLGPMGLSAAMAQHGSTPPGAHVRFPTAAAPSASTGVPLPGSRVPTLLRPGMREPLPEAEAHGADGASFEPGAFPPQQPGNAAGAGRADVQREEWEQEGARPPHEDTDRNRTPSPHRMPPPAGVSSAGDPGADAGGAGTESARLAAASEADQYRELLREAEEGGDVSTVAARLLDPATAHTEEGGAAARAPPLLTVFKQRLLAHVFGELRTALRSTVPSQPNHAPAHRGLHRLAGGLQDQGNGTRDRPNVGRAWGVEGGHQNERTWEAAGLGAAGPGVHMGAKEESGATPAVQQPHAHADAVGRMKRFLYHFQHYCDLIMWKVQLLDRSHILVKMGSAADGVPLPPRSSDSSSSSFFFAVYNLHTTEMVAFFLNSSDELLDAFEKYCDHFRAPPQQPAALSLASSCSNNAFARELHRKHRTALSVSTKGGSSLQAVKRMLAALPLSCQSSSVSPYFDHGLFHFDDKLISPSDRHKPWSEHPIKFMSRRRPNVLRFKLQPYVDPTTTDTSSRTKRIASFIFHPFLPFVISIQQVFMQPAVVNFYFRR